MTVTFEPPKTSVHTPSKPSQSENTIDLEVLKEFVGEIEHLLKIDCIKVGNNKFRINVWTQRYINESVVPTNRIVKSFYVEYKNNKIVDRTILERK